MYKKWLYGTMMLSSWIFILALFVLLLFYDKIILTEPNLFILVIELLMSIVFVIYAIDFVIHKEVVN